ncbi:MAG: MFS transporter [Atribacterota bacterium]|nr:MFS transporter [Atribacterota bacterium]
MLRKQNNIQLKLNSLGHAYNDAYHYIIPLLLPFFRQEFAFTYFQSGLILTFHEAIRSIFSLVFGSLADRYNHKNLIISSGFILASVLLGSVIYVNNLSLIITALLLMAIGTATFHPLATAMVGERALPGEEGRDLSLFSAAGTFGLIITSLLFGWLVQIWGWRITCLIISLPGFFLGISYLKIKNETKKETGKIEKKLNSRNIFVIYFLCRVIMCLGTKPFLSFLPIYATTYVGLKPGVSAWIVSIYFIGVFSGSLLISKFLDKQNPLKYSILATFFTSILVYILTCFRIPFVIGLLIGSIGLMEGIYFPSQHTWLTRSGSTKIQGKLFGFGFFIEGVSATIAPSIYGWLADKFGLLFAYRFASLPIFISFLSYIYLYWLSENYRNSKTGIQRA